MGRPLVLGVSLASTTRGRGPSAYQFEGSSVFMPTSFNAERHESCITSSDCGKIDKYTIRFLIDKTLK